MRIKKIKLGIWGWWQGHNLGDNWIKNTMKTAFPFAKFVPTNIRFFWNIDFMICGGGGLFIYDVIRPWNKPENIKIPFGIMGMGAEFPHTSSLAKKLDEKAEFFYVRDQYSIDCMGLGEKNKSYDCTFIEPLKWNERQDMNESKLFFVWRDGYELLSNEQFNDYICYEEGVDEAWKSLIHSHFTEIVADDFQTNEADIEERIAGAGFVISGRFHGIVAAIQKGIPFIAIDICPKIRILAQDAGLEEYCVKINEVDKAEALIEKARNEVELIREKEAQYREKAYHKMQRDVGVAYEAIYKACKPFRAMYYPTNPDGICEMKQQILGELEKMCELKTNVHALTSPTDAGDCAGCLDYKQIVRDLRRTKADFIVLDSEDVLIDDAVKALLHKRGIQIIRLSALRFENVEQVGEEWVKVLRTI